MVPIKEKTFRCSYVIGFIVNEKNGLRPANTIEKAQKTYLHINTELPIRFQGTAVNSQVSPVISGKTPTEQRSKQNKTETQKGEREFSEQNET